MGVFGSKSPKPHKLYSNDHGMLLALFERAGYMPRDLQRQCAVATTRKYIDTSGKRRCVGIKDALKESAYLES